MNKESYIKHIAQRSEDYMAESWKDRSEEMLSKQGFKAYSNHCENVLKAMKITVEEKARGEEDIKTLHTRLNTESGIVIANHPFGGDTVIVNSLIKREDVLILVGNHVSDYSEEIPKYLITPGTTVGEKRKMLQQVIEHINNDGLFVIYPSGGDGPNGKGFKDGFKTIVSHIDPDKMIYSVYFNPDDQAKIHNDYIHNQLQRSVSGLQPELTPLGTYEPVTAHLEEVYSKAGEWQKITETTDNRAEQNQLLTNHFYNQFNQ